MDADDRCFSIGILPYRRSRISAARRRLALVVVAAVRAASATLAAAVPAPREDPSNGAP
jgi:hypothetical protein